MILERAVSYLGYSLFGSIAGFLTLIYMTRALNPAEMGVLGVFAAVIFILVPVIGFNSEALVSINKTVLEEIDYLTFRNVYLSFSCLLFFLIYLFSLIFVLFYEQAYLFFVFLVVPIAFFRYISRVHSSELIQEGNSSLFGRLQLSTSIGVLVLTVSLISIFDLSWKGRLLSIFLVEALFSIYRVRFKSEILMSYSVSYEKEEIVKILRYGTPLFLALAISWVIFESDKVIVLNYFSISDLGFYTVAFSIGAFFNVINTSVAQAVLPKLYAKLHNNEGYDLIVKYNIFYSAFILFFASIVSVFFYYFSGPILGDMYEDSKIITCIVLFSYAIFGISRTSGIILNFYKLNILKTKLMFVAAAVNLIFSISMISILGLEAPAYGTLLSFFVMAGLFYVYSRKELRVRGVKK